MTELAIPDNQGEIVPAEMDMTALVKWAYGARHATQVAASLCKTSFVPRAMQGNVHEVTGVILAGDELGLKPMAALRSIDIIQGTPALRAHTMRGLLQSHGHSVQVVGKATPTRVEMRGKRAGETDADWQYVEWTIERAAQLGLTAKPEWKKQPQTMLIARATGEICRLVAADVLFAIPYAAEELEGSSHEASVGGVRRVGVPTAAEVMGDADPEPPQSAEPESVPDDEPQGEPATDEPIPATRAQLTKLHASLNDFAVTEKSDKLTTVGILVGRTLMSSSELSKVEASKVIETLGRLAEQGDQDDRVAALDYYLANLDAAGGES